MNCKNCGYGLKQRCGDFEKIICTYEEGECVKITELEAQLIKAKEIIKTFLGFAEAFGYSPSIDKFITEAEQFLNSEVEK